MLIEFKTAQQADLIRIAQCHKIVFPRALTSKMGVNYLTKIFSWYLSTDKAFLFFIQDNKKMVGYAGGILVDGTLAHGSASSMTQHTFNDAIKALLLRPWLLVHPDFLSRYHFFVRNILTRFSSKLNKREVRSTAQQVDPHTGLVVIGVVPSFQGKGYGTMLLNEFERISLAKGFKRMILTVNPGNDQAIQSYIRNGWSVTSANGKAVSMEKVLN